MKWYIRTDFFQNPITINWCGTCKNIYSWSFFSIGTCELTNIMIITKNSKQTSVQKILQFYNQ